MHPVFHVSVLKPFRGSHSLSHQPLPSLTIDSHPVDLSLAICDSRSIIRNGNTMRQILVQWTGCQLEDASWEDFVKFCKLYPSCHLEDKVIFEVNENDTLPLSLEEPVEEDLKEKKVAQVSDKEAQEIMGKLVAKTQIEQVVDIPKRVSKKPASLNDYV